MFLKQILGAACKVVKSNVIPTPTYARTICKGSGTRVYVKGFASKPNLDPVRHEELLKIRKSMNYRPIVSGFTGRKNMVLPVAPENKSFCRFMPIYKSKMLQRHRVFDVAPVRIKVQGFTANPISNRAVTKLQTTEPIVVRGFSSNSSRAHSSLFDTPQGIVNQQPVTGGLEKQVNIVPQKEPERVVVRGFCQT